MIATSFLVRIRVYLCSERPSYVPPDDAASVHTFIHAVSHAVIHCYKYMLYISTVKMKWEIITWPALK